MKPYQKLRRVKASERIYSWLVRMYPSPFRVEFGTSMKQVFRDQCLDVVERKGTVGLMALWLRVLPDFVWTCPKEHIVALPTLPRRILEAIAEQSIWRLPALFTAAWLLLAVTVTLVLPQYYSSTATIEVKKLPVPDGTEVEFDPYFLQTEFEKLTSKTVLYPVIEALNLQDHYGHRSSTTLTPPYRLSDEETYQLLRSNLDVSQYRSTELISVTVFDPDPELASRIANEIVAGYQQWRHAETVTALLRSRGSAPDQTAPPLEVSIRSDERSDAKRLAASIAAAHRSVKIINPAEVGLRPVRPNRYLNIFLGAVAAMGVGGITLIGLWIVRRLRNRVTVPA